jgi:sorbitol-specific phosphotransferase system component IIC
MWQLIWESPSSTKIFNGLQCSFQVWQGFINVTESFSYINVTDFLVYLGLLNGEKKSDFSIFRIVIFEFLLFFIIFFLVFGLLLLIWVCKWATT